MASFFNLPRELRDMIYDQVKLDPPPSETWAGYASSCKEWQEIFEPMSFRVLTLDQDRVEDLASIIDCSKLRLKSIREICLRVELRKYFPSEIENDYDTVSSEKNDEMFEETLRTLMEWLSTWSKPAGANTGIRLEVGAYSPNETNYISDRYHLDGRRPVWTVRGNAFEDDKRNVFRLRQGVEPGWKVVSARRTRYRHLGQFNYLRAFTPIGQFSDREFRALVLNELEEQVINEPEPEPVSFIHQNSFQLLGDPDQPQPIIRSSQPRWGWKTTAPRVVDKFPPVSVVSHFMVRRQCCRIISPTVIDMLLHSFTALEDWSYTSWSDEGRTAKGWHGSHFMRRLASLLQRQELPASLRNISLFRESNDPLNGWQWYWPTVDVGFEGDRVVLHLVQKGTGLEQLSLAYVANADNFFTHARRHVRVQLDRWDITVRWQLKYLSLTSWYLAERWGPTNPTMDMMLVRAARVVMRNMPEMRVMEIWHMSAHSSLLFCYYRTGRKHRIVTAGTYKPRLKNLVLPMWDFYLKQQFPNRKIYYKHKPLAPVEWYGDLFQHSRIPDGVRMDWFSEQQLIEEWKRNNQQSLVMRSR